VKYSRRIKSESVSKLRLVFAQNVALTILQSSHPALYFVLLVVVAKDDRQKKNAWNESKRPGQAEELLLFWWSPVILGFGGAGVLVSVLWGHELTGYRTPNNSYLSHV
jgi:hypothetical protein